MMTHLPGYYEKGIFKPDTGGANIVGYQAKVATQVNTLLDNFQTWYVSSASIQLMLPQQTDVTFTVNKVAGGFMILPLDSNNVKSYYAP